MNHSRVLIGLAVLCALAACTAAPVTPAALTPTQTMSVPVTLSASKTPAKTPGAADTAGVFDTPTPAAAVSEQVSPTPALAPTATSAVATAMAALGATTPGRMENFTLLGRDPLAGRGWNAGLALAYPCAYVGSRRVPTVAIVDVTDPAQPQSAGSLNLAPGLQPAELRALPDLGLLVVMNFSSVVSLMTFDVHDCLHPRPLGSLPLGGVPHEFYLWRDPAQPTRVLAYVAMFNSQPPDLHVVDLSDPAAPRQIGDWTAARDGAAGTLHSISLSPDGQTAYLSMWSGGFLLADTSDFALARPQPRLRLLNPAHPLLPPPGVDVHSAVPVPGTSAVLLTQEIYSCPFGGLALADLHNPAQPQLMGAFSLPEDATSACSHLPEADAVFTAHNPLVVGTLAFVTWYGGGMQALDVAQPTQPRRVGLFVPDGSGPLGGSPYGRYPVQLWSYPILRQGVLYVSDIQAGLFVLRYTGPGTSALDAVPLAQGNASWNP